MQKIYYHVRHVNGVSVDWLEDRNLAVSLARKEGAQCFVVDSVSGVSARIY
jgi:hypothetical protein